MTFYIDKRYFNEYETSFQRDLFSTLLQEDLFSNQVIAESLLISKHQHVMDSNINSV